MPIKTSTCFFTYGKTDTKLVIVAFEIVVAVVNVVVAVVVIEYANVIGLIRLIRCCTWRRGGTLFILTFI